MYINKQYLALTAILAILTAVVFKSDSTDTGTTFIWIPFVVAAIVCLMRLVTFLINKTAGYVRLIEWQLNQLYDSDFPGVREDSEFKQFLAPMLWEGHYADNRLNFIVGSAFIGGTLRKNHSLMKNDNLVR